MERYILITGLLLFSLILIAGCISLSPQGQNTSVPVINKNFSNTSLDEKPKYTAISAGGTHNLALYSNGTVSTWCTQYRKAICTIPNNLTDVVSISAGKINTASL